MIKLIRKLITSKIGVAFTLALLVLIAFAFGLSDVSNQGSFGGVSGADRVAIVGDTKISTSELSQAVTNGLTLLRQRSPTATMESYVAAGGFDQALQQVIDSAAFAEFGRKSGLRAGVRLVNSEIAQAAAFKGPDGQFDDNTYRTWLANQGTTDEQVRRDLGRILLARQASAPVSLGSNMPASLAKRYISLLQERRKGEFGLLPSAAFVPAGNPTDAQLQAYYNAHRTDYLRPERRLIRYASFGDEALGTLTAPSDAQIKARYDRDQLQYAASELRSVSMLVLPSAAEANAVRDAAARGTSLDAAASARGLKVSHTEPLRQNDLAGRESLAVAQAAFKTAQGAIAEPVKGPLGTYLVRVDEIRRTPGRSLDQVRGEILKALTAEQRKAALADLSAQIEEEIDSGDSLVDVAQTLKLKLATTPELTGDGRVYGSAQGIAPPVLARALSTAFAMSEGEPQLAEVEPGVTFLVYDVARIVPSAAAPLAEIKGDVALAWKRSEGNKAAKEAAKRVMDRLAKGSDLSAALNAEGKPLPPVSNVDLTRQQLALVGQRIPSVFALLFSMAQRTVKRLEAPNENGWFVVKLDQIEPGAVKDQDPAFANAQQELGQVVGNEYGDEFLRAIELEIGVEKHQTSIDAVKAQLTGRNQQ